MKKLLAILLAALMLVGFGALANAQTPTELEAEGRALLTQTMEDLRGDYAIANWGITHSEGRYATGRVDSFREIFLGDEMLRVYPELGIYVRYSPSPVFHWRDLLTPHDVAAETPISVERVAGGGLVVILGRHRYTYDDDGVLLHIWHEGRTMQKEGFSKDADLGVFSVEGMREVSAFTAWRMQQAQFREDENLWDVIRNTLSYYRERLEYQVERREYNIESGLTQRVIQEYAEAIEEYLGFEISEPFVEWATAAVITVIGWMNSIYRFLLIFLPDLR